MKYVEYDQEKHGEIVSAPEEFIEAIKGLPLDEQIKRFRLIEGHSRGERSYGSEFVRSHYSNSTQLEKNSYCHAAIVKDGTVVGILSHSDCRREFAVYPNETYYVYSTEDNNGAGYLTYDEYMTLICVMD